LNPNEKSLRVKRAIPAGFTAAQETSPPKALSVPAILMFLAVPPNWYIEYRKASTSFCAVIVAVAVKLHQATKKNFFME
jgi:hypothetical protein